MKHTRPLLLILLCFLPLSAKPSDSTAVSPEIIHTRWFSHYEQIERRVDIYVPEADHPLPVLYLIHGINGYEGAWQDRGQAVDTLAAMIAEGRCPPMILVMPDCNIPPIPSPTKPRWLGSPMVRVSLRT